MKSSAHSIPLVPFWLRGMRILIVAVILNIIATELRIDTWYEFLQSPFIARSILDFLFLFILYPLALGAAAMK